jgi:hypothetical protein
MDISAVMKTIVGQWKLQCYLMAITIYRERMRLFPPIWLHRHLMIVSTTVCISQ